MVTPGIDSCINPGLLESGVRSGLTSNGSNFLALGVLGVLVLLGPFHLICTPHYVRGQ